MRVVNLNEDPVRMPKNQFQGGMHPVYVELSNLLPAYEASPIELLLADLPDEVSPDIRERLGKMLAEYEDVFSATDKNFGRKWVCTYNIETGDTRPVRQPLRRHPLLHMATL